MPYREKIAWLSLVAMAVTYGPYFAIVAAGTFESQSLPNLPQLGLFAATTIVQMLILLGGRAYLRRRDRDDARVPPDERDRAIERRSINWAYFVLMAGMILVGCILPFIASGWTIVNAAILAIVSAEVVQYSVALSSYRRQV